MTVPKLLLEKFRDLKEYGDQRRIARDYLGATTDVEVAKGAKRVNEVFRNGRGAELLIKAMHTFYAKKFATHSELLEHFV